MGPRVCPETSVRYYYYSMRNVPEDRSSQLLCGGSQKSSIALRITNPVSIKREQNELQNELQ